MLSSDIGSLPARIDQNIIDSGARKTNSLLPYLGVESQDHTSFEEEVVSAFIDKINAGLHVPTFPQFRDMNEMFFELMDGIERSNGALHAVNGIKARSNSAIPETEALRRSTKRLKEVNDDKVSIRVCVTGPYTLASFFQFKTPTLYLDLAKAVAKILESSLFNNANAGIKHVCVDEPVLGFLNDPLLDYGSDGRESLRKAWDSILGVAKTRGIDTSIHLHDTSENLFWDVENLDLIGSHVGDPLYSQESVKKKLAETDKRLWAPACVTQYDTLIENYYTAQGFSGNIPEKIGDTWTSLRKGNIDPYLFLESKDDMAKNIEKVTSFFGDEMVEYVSPECGLNSFPEYDVAIEYLSRVAAVSSGQ